MSAIGPANRTRSYAEAETTMVPSTEAPTGCPLVYDWCFYTPIIKIYQYIIGVILLVSFDLNQYFISINNIVNSKGHWLFDFERKII